MPMTSILALPRELTAAMISGTAVTAGSLANLISNKWGLVARWAGTVATYNIDIDLLAAQSIDVVGALWSNLRTTDTVRVTAGTAPGGATLYDSGTFNPHYNGSTRDTSAGTKSLHVLATPVSARYWRIAIGVVGTTLPEGYLQLSRIFLGKRLIFNVDYSGIEYVVDDRSVVDQSDYGEDVEDLRRITMGWRVKFNFGSQDEFLASQRKLAHYGIAKPVFFLPIPSASDAQDLMAFGPTKAPSKVQSTLYDIWEFGFDVISLAA
jgi:hypothetical protein